MRAALTICAAAVALTSSTACRTTHALEDRPAVIVKPDARSRAALTAALRAALHGAPVTVAEEALTGTSTLVVERVRRRDASGLPLDGREVEPPERFQLVKNGAECVLVRERTRERFTLAQTECLPL